MFTVMVGFEGSGKSSTCRPLGRRYSVMPSTSPIFLSNPAAWAGAFATAAGLFDSALAPGAAGGAFAGAGGVAFGGAGGVVPGGATGGEGFFGSAVTSDAGAAFFDSAGDSGLADCASAIEAAIATKIGSRLAEAVFMGWVARAGGTGGRLWQRREGQPSRDSAPPERFSAGRATTGAAPRPRHGRPRLLPGRPWCN